MPVVKVFQAPSLCPHRAHHGRVFLTFKGGDMGRIGRSYPRFEEAHKPGLPESHPAAEGPAERGYQVIGAIIGLLSALGLIGWLLTR